MNTFNGSYNNNFTAVLCQTSTGFSVSSIWRADYYTWPVECVPRDILAPLHVQNVPSCMAPWLFKALSWHTTPSLFKIWLAGKLHPDPINMRFKRPLLQIKKHCSSRRFYYVPCISQKFSAGLNHVQYMCRSAYRVLQQWWSSCSVVARRGIG